MSPGQRPPWPDTARPSDVSTFISPVARHGETARSRDAIRLIPRERGYQVTNQEFTIELDDDTQGHAALRAVVETEDTAWLQDAIGADGGSRRVRLLPDEGDDVEGHAAGTGARVRVMLEGDDDTEGHAIAVHFPSRAEADAFRRRLLMTGVLVGSVALGAAGGAGLSALQSESGAEAGLSQAQVQSNYREAAANEGMRQGAADAQARAQANYREAAANEGARQGGGAAAADLPSAYQEAAANEAARQSGAADQAATSRLDQLAATTQSGEPSADRAEAYRNYQEAAASEAARQSGAAAAADEAATSRLDQLAATTQSGAPSAERTAADQAATDRLNAQAAASQAEAAERASTERLDELAATTQSGPSAADEDSNELNDIGGPTPR